MEYILMHRTKEIARIELDEFSNIASIYEVYDSKHLPVGTVQKEVVNKRALAKWWSGRSIPASRQGLKEALQKLGMTVSQELLDKCYGLSLGFYLKVNESHGKQLTFLIILFQRMLEIFCLVMAVHLRV